MNKLTSWVVERGIVTNLNIFNHKYAKLGWLIMMKYVKNMQYASKEV